MKRLTDEELKEQLELAEIFSGVKLDSQDYIQLLTDIQLYKTALQEIHERCEAAYGYESNKDFRALALEQACSFASVEAAKALTDDEKKENDDATVR